MAVLTGFHQSLKFTHWLSDALKSLKGKARVVVLPKELFIKLNILTINFMKEKEAFYRCIRILDSCSTYEQLRPCEKMVESFLIKFRNKKRYQVLKEYMNYRLKSLLVPYGD